MSTTSVGWCVHAKLTKISSANQKMQQNQKCKFRKTATQKTQKQNQKFKFRNTLTQMENVSPY